VPRKNDMRAIGSPANSFVASASPLSTRGMSKPSDNGDTGWQSALWDYFDCIGEFEYVANWVGNLISRAELYAAKDGVRQDEGPAADAVAELFGSVVGKRRCLRKLGIQATVPGESYIFSWGPDESRQWDVFSSQAVSKLSESSDWKVQGMELDGEIFVMRSWDRHPRHPERVMSPSKSALPVLNEIYRLTQHIDAQVSSRLASAGLLLIPNEMAFAAATEKENDEIANQSKAQEFVKELSETMSTAINDRSDASALVPIVVTADGDILDKPRLLTFWTDLDEHSIELRQEAIRRLALSLDIPPEILSGTGDASHWQAWGIDDAAIKTHSEPLLMRLTGDVTEGFLWPALKGLVPDEEIQTYTIEADTSAMRVRPNRSKESIELFNLGELSAETMRKENGFDKIDEPDANARKNWLLSKIATMATTPAMAATAARALGVQLPVEISKAGREKTPDPSLDDHPDRTAVPSDAEKRDLDVDAERKANTAAVAAAAEQIVFRALERGGNKLKSRMKFVKEGVAPSELYLFRQSSDAEASFMLEGSFDHVQRFTGQFSVSGEWLSSSLEEYCRGLILNREPHTMERLTRSLRTEKVNA